MARWCIKKDRGLNDDNRFNVGCTDEWGTRHQCKGCPHNMYMDDGKGFEASGSNMDVW